MRSAVLDLPIKAPDDCECRMLCAVLAPRIAMLADLRASDLPASWREQIVDTDGAGEPSGRAVTAAIVLLLCTARCAGLRRAYVDDDLVHTILCAAELGLALDALRSDAVITDFSGDGLGTTLAGFVEHCAATGLRS